MPRNKPRTRVGGVRTHVGNGTMTGVAGTKLLTYGIIENNVAMLQMLGENEQEISARVKDILARKWRPSQGFSLARGTHSETSPALET